MLDYLLSGANIMYLAGCVYAAYLIVVHGFRPRQRQTGVMKGREAYGRHLPSPSFDYYS